MSFKKFDTHKNLPKLGKAFLDSGAFSVLTGQWERLPVDAHIRFIEEHHNHFELIAAPDVIGSAEQTFINLKYFIEAFKKLGLWDIVKNQIVVTYHLGDRDYKTMAYMLTFAWNEGIKWLAVGGIVTPGTSMEQRYVGISEVLHQVKHKLKLPFKIHLFGGYNGEYIRAFMPESVDSSTYLQKARMLHSFRYEPKTWNMKTVNAPRDNDERLLDFVMEQFKPLYKIIGNIDTHELRNEMQKLPDGVKFWVINGLYMRLFEKEVQQTKPDFKYWVTIAGLDDGMRYGDYVSNFLFTKMWQNNTLVAFPMFYEKGNFTNTQKLELFKS
jgi:hypothetical protein